MGVKSSAPTISSGILKPKRLICSKKNKFCNAKRGKIYNCSAIFADKTIRIFTTLKNYQHVLKAAANERIA